VYHQVLKTILLAVPGNSFNGRDFCVEGGLAGPKGFGTLSNCGPDSRLVGSDRDHGYVAAGRVRSVSLLVLPE
jgi:hypothetical protein